MSDGRAAAPIPCEAIPEDATTKTIALEPCPKCKSTECWLYYLRFEVKTGVDLNADQHHKVR